MIRILALRTATAATLVGTATTAQNICGEQLDNINALGDEIAMNTKKAGGDYDCSTQCSAEPDCVAFIQGGTLTARSTRWTRP